jgi:hypothetical protein
VSKIPYKKLLVGDLSWKRLIRSVLFIYAFFAVYVFFRADSMIFMPQTVSNFCGYRELGTMILWRWLAIDCERLYHPLSGRST